MRNYGQAPRKRYDDQVYLYFCFTSILKCNFDCDAYAAYLPHILAKNIEYLSEDYNDALDLRAAQSELFSVLLKK